MQELVGRALAEQRLLITVTRERTIRLLPPLVCDEAQIDEIVARLARLLSGDSARIITHRMPPALSPPARLKPGPEAMTIASPTLQDFDPELAQAMRAEAMRQEDHAELIASENYASPLVMAVQDSVFTNKYAEGYPPPLLQRLRARGRGRTPGAGAGQGAVRLRLRQRPAACRRPGQRGRVPALTRPGDTVMGMNLAQGGHLTHGNPSISRAGTITSCPTAWIPRPG